MLIRQETPKDFAEVEELIENSFANAEHSDGNEHKLVAALRKSTAFVPELSIVAESSGRLVGYILFTEAQVDGQTVLALAPLAVAPDAQKQGIGSALMRVGHQIAKELGYSYSIVLGSEQYYPRLGYLPAEQFSIVAPFEVPKENFMALCLQDRAVAIKGVVQYAAEFGI